MEIRAPRHAKHYNILYTHLPGKLHRRMQSSEVEGKGVYGGSGTRGGRTGQIHLSSGDESRVE